MSRSGRLGAALAVVLAAAPRPGAAQAPGASGPVARAILASGQSTRVAVALDDDVYDRARSDLGDLRVVDDTGAEVPYLLDRAPTEPGPLRRALRLTRAWTRDGVSVTTDLGAPVLKRSIVVRLAGEEFERRVKVEGKGRHDPRWTTLVDGAWVTASGGVRHETVALPENNHRFLRVTVARGRGEARAPAVRELWVRHEVGRRRITAARSVPFTRRSEGASTFVAVDLGVRHRPFLGLRLEVAPGDFVRGASVEVQDGEGWREVGEGVLFRAPAGVNVDLEAPGRGPALRLRLDGDGRAPLALRGVSALLPVERVVFAAAPGRQYRLRYGDGTEPPQYGIQRTIGDAVLWGATAERARLEPLLAATGS